MPEYASFFVPGIMQRIAQTESKLVRSVVQKTMLPQFVMQERQISLTYTVGQSVLENLATELALPTLGLEFGKKHRDLAYNGAPHAGVVRYAAESGASIRAYFETLARYSTLVSPTLIMHAFSSEDAFTVEFFESQSPTGLGIHHQMFVATLILNGMKRLVGRACTNARVGFASKISALQKSAFQDAFSCEVVPCSSRSFVCVPIDYAELRMLTRNEDLHAALCLSLDSISGASGFAECEPHLVAQVSKKIREYLGHEEVSLERVAKELHVTPRSLQRALQERKTSFRALKEAVRLQRMTSADMHSKRLSASALGYRASSSVVRARKRLQKHVP